MNNSLAKDLKKDKEGCSICLLFIVFVLIGIFTQSCNSHKQYQKFSQQIEEERKEISKHSYQVIRCITKVRTFKGHHTFSDECIVEELSPNKKRYRASCGNTIVVGDVGKLKIESPARYLIDYVFIKE